MIYSAFSAPEATNATVIVEPIPPIFKNASHCAPAVETKIKKNAIAWKFFISL
jgi:hypothetical protein